jgi:hypothetical protein
MQGNDRSAGIRDSIRAYRLAFIGKILKRA